MSFTWLIRNATTTNAIGHSYAAGSPNDTYGNTRFYTSFNLSSYADADTVIYGPTADGSITRTETVLAGDPPTPGS